MLGGYMLAMQVGPLHLDWVDQLLVQHADADAEERCMKKEAKKDGEEKYEIWLEGWPA